MIRRLGLISFVVAVLFLPQSAVGGPARVGGIPMAVSAPLGDAPDPETETSRPDEAPDPARAYALSVRREGAGLIALGAGTAVASVASALLLVAVAPEAGAFAPYLVGVGLPVAAGLVVAGLPAAMRGSRYLKWHAERGGAPSAQARWRLMERWSTDLLRVRRDTGLIGGAALGLAGVLSGIAWAVADQRGSNGVQGHNYDPGDALTTTALLGVATGSAVMGLVSGLEFRRLTADPAAKSPPPPLASLAVTPGPGSVGLAVGLSGRF
jgi:hypothetical protein